MIIFTVTFLFNSCSSYTKFNASKWVWWMFLSWANAYIPEVFSSTHYSCCENSFRRFSTECFVLSIQVFRFIYLFFFSLNLKHQHKTDAQCTPDSERSCSPDFFIWKSNWIDHFDSSGKRDQTIISLCPS